MKGTAGNAPATKALMVRLPPDLHDALCKLAAKQDRSVSAQIRVLIAEATEVQA